MKEEEILNKEIKSYLTTLFFFLSFFQELSWEPSLLSLCPVKSAST